MKLADRCQETGVDEYRILVTGSRHWVDETAIKDAVADTVRLVSPRPVRIIHGGCPTGADAIAAEVAETFGLATDVYPADWDRHGKSAGPIRNQEMADAGADVCLAFMLPESRGARDCARRARNAGIFVKTMHRPTAAQPEQRNDS